MSFSNVRTLLEIPCGYFLVHSVLGHLNSSLVPQTMYMNINKYILVRLHIPSAQTEATKVLIQSQKNHHLLPQAGK